MVDKLVSLKAVWTHWNFLIQTVNLDSRLHSEYVSDVQVISLQIIRIAIFDIYVFRKSRLSMF